MLVAEVLSLEDITNRHEQLCIQYLSWTRITRCKYKLYTSILRAGKGLQAMPWIYLDGQSGPLQVLPEWDVSGLPLRVPIESWVNYSQRYFTHLHFGGVSIPSRHNIHNLNIVRLHVLPPSDVEQYPEFPHPSSGHILESGLGNAVRFQIDNKPVICLVPAAYWDVVHNLRLAPT